MEVAKRGLHTAIAGPTVGAGAQENPQALQLFGILLFAGTIMDKHCCGISTRKHVSCQAARQFFEAYTRRGASPDREAEPLSSYNVRCYRWRGRARGAFLSCRSIEPYGILLATAYSQIASDP